jgi:hypothetical protein
MEDREECTPAFELKRGKASHKRNKNEQRGEIVKGGCKIQAM